MTHRADALKPPGRSFYRAIWSDRAFVAGLAVICTVYTGMILAMLLADAAYMVQETLQFGKANPILEAFRDAHIRYAIMLSLISCSIAAFLSIWVAVPVGYLLSRYRFPGCRLIDAVLDIPIVLPPLVVGLSLLILFQYPPFSTPFGEFLPVTGSWAEASLASLTVYQVPSVILAQFMVATAFAVRTMKAAFELIDPRCEKVALTLGCSRFQAFMRVVAPETGSSILTAWTLSWARSLGEFGPLLIFAGATRGKTEVLSTTVFLELSIGNLGAAVAVSLIMVVAAMAVLIIARVWGSKELIF